MAGNNIASYSNSAYDAYLAESVAAGSHMNYDGNSGELRRCFFLSHRKCDEEAAEAVGKYITDKLGFDIFLDKYDLDLQKATYEGDDKKVTEIIKKGLNASTHLLCIVSQDTQVSWWVPYEIGFADKLGLEIASIKIGGGVIHVPSYLKIHNFLSDTNDLKDYLKNGTFQQTLNESKQERFDSRYGGLFRKGEYVPGSGGRPPEGEALIYHYFR